MTKKKANTKELKIVEIIVVRGIENEDGYRVEAGEKVLLSELEKHFDLDVIKHWLKTGVLSNA